METGSKAPLLRCQLCGKAFELADATSKPVDELPDRFAARCPHCHAQCLYARADIVKPVNDP